MSFSENELVDWRRRIFGLYGSVRSNPIPQDAWKLWKTTRDEMFRDHPQSPVPPGKVFSGLSYFEYDLSARVMAELAPAAPRKFAISSNPDSTHAFHRFAVASFELWGVPSTLEVYWLEGYAGGIFLPFKDAGAGTITYGGGRYLLDTAKGADLGARGDELVLDFNFSYQPSCSYSSEWSCPLAPPRNTLPFEVRAGERL